MDTLALCNFLEIEISEFRKSFEEIKIIQSIKQVFFINKSIINKLVNYRKNYFNFPAFFLQTINTRKYLTESSAHVLGYLGEVNKEKIKLDKYYNKGDLYGCKRNRSWI